MQSTLRDTCRLCTQMLSGGAGAVSTGLRPTWVLGYCRARPASFNFNLALLSSNLAAFISQRTLFKATEVIRILKKIEENIRMQIAKTEKNYNKVHKTIHTVICERKNLACETDSFTADTTSWGALFCLVAYQKISYETSAESSNCL